MLSAEDIKISYVAIVGAADGVGRAAASSADPNDGDRGAGHPEEDIDVLDDDAKCAQQRGAGGGACLPSESRKFKHMHPEGTRVVSELEVAGPWGDVERG